MGAILQSLGRTITAGVILLVIFIVIAGLAGYWIYLSVSAITTNRLATLLVVFMASATLASMATAQDPQWWEYHFSQLGTAEDFSSGLFNLALLVAGAFVTTFALYVHRDLTTLVRQGVLVHDWAPRFVAVVFVVMGVMLAGVGVFPLTVSVTLHNSCAVGMSLSFLVLLVSSPWTLTGLPARFFWWFSISGPNTLSSPGGQKVRCVSGEL